MRQRRGWAGAVRRVALGATAALTAASMLTQPSARPPVAASPATGPVTAPAFAGGALRAAPPALPESLTVPAPPAYALARAELGDGRRVVLRWNPCQVITLKVNVAAVPAAQRAGVLAEVRSAVSRLSRATGVTYSYRGTTTVVPRRANVDRLGAELVVAVVPATATDFGLGNGVIGFGGYRYWEWSSVGPAGSAPSQAAIARGWVVLDVASFLATPRGTGAGVTRGNVVLHELAHTLGLDHVENPTQLMNPVLLPGSPRGYAAGDLAGLHRLGRSAGCLQVPDSVVADLG